MCGIAGIIHRGKTGAIGREMTLMLQSMKHRGPDSAGFAVYGTPRAGELAIRFKVAENVDLAAGFEIHDQIKARRAAVDERIRSLGGEVVSVEQATEYAYLYRVKYDGDLRRFADYIEDVEGAEILSIGRGLELVKDLGDASQVSRQYRLGEFVGTHAIGHVRMATEVVGDKKIMWGSDFPHARCTYPNSQQVVEDTPPLLGAALGMSFGMVVLGIISAPDLRRDVGVRRRAWVWAALGGLAAGGGITLMFQAVANAPVVVVAPILAMNPLTAILFSQVFIRGMERLTWRVLIGAVLVVIGVIIISLAQNA